MMSIDYCAVCKKQFYGAWLRQNAMVSNPTFFDTTVTTTINYTLTTGTATSPLFFSASAQSYLDQFCHGVGACASQECPECGWIVQPAAHPPERCTELKNIYVALSLVDPITHTQEEPKTAIPEPFYKAFEGES